MVILDCATKWKADLIVVGSHGKNGIQRLLLGSVSEYVATHAKCSVEIVRGAPVRAVTAV
jgi:nucleotide-binding universal stress UspA family protein